MRTLRLGNSLFRADALLRKYAHFEDPAPAPTPDPAPTSPPPEDKKFTQAEMDKVQGKTRAEAKQVALNDFLKELGFEKADDLKTLVTSAKKRADDEKSDLEKAQQAATDAENKRKVAEEALTKFQSEVETEKRLARRDSAIATAAKTDHAHVPEDVIVWAEANAAEALAKTVKEDGTTDASAITALVKKCREARPLWFGKAGVGTQSNAGGRLPSGERPKVQTSGRL